MTGHGAVVIGAGLNSLVAATILARRGIKVLVVERRDTVGGSAVATEFAPGFRCDAGAHDAGYIAPGLVRSLGLANHGLELVPAGSHLLAPYHADGGLMDSARLSANVESIRALSRADAARWPAFSARVARLAGFLRALAAAPAPNVEATAPRELVELAATGLRLRLLGKKDMVELLRVAPMSVAELVEDEFESDVLKGVLGAQGIRHLCQGPRSAGTAFTFLHHQMGRSAGEFHATLTPRRGAGDLATALANAARAAGVEIRTSATVARIALREGRAAGVVLRSGDVIAAPTVVSGADPRRTFLQLCDASRLEPEFVRAVRHIRFRGVWAQVQLALDGLPRLGDVSRTDLATCRSLSISPSLTWLERAYDYAKYGQVSERPYLDVRIPSLGDTALAPEGKHVMSVHVQYAPYHRRDGAWDDRARDALGDLVVAALGEWLPELPSRVLHRRVRTPLDLEHEFGLPEGHAYHGEMTLDQILFMRPVAGWSRHRTPVAGLYLCGPGTHPGGGVMGGSGVLAAQAVLRDTKR